MWQLRAIKLEWLVEWNGMEWSVCPRCLEMKLPQTSTEIKCCAEVEIWFCYYNDYNIVITLTVITAGSIMKHTLLTFFPVTLTVTRHHHNTGVRQRSTPVCRQRSTPVCRKRLCVTWLLLFTKHIASFPFTAIVKTFPFFTIQVVLGYE